MTSEEEADKAEAAKCRDIFQAVEKGNIGAVRHFLRVDPGSVNGRDRFGLTSLHLAAEQGHVAVAELLIAKGAALEATDINGRTPLHFAARHDQVAVAELLIAKGAAVNATDNDRWTPLHLAAVKDHVAVAELLIGQGAALKATDNNGDTPLHHAAYNKPAMVELLLSRGATVDVKNNDGDTPLHWAARNNHAAMVELLLSRGAAVDVRNNDGKTPLDLAREKGYTEVEQVLLNPPAKAPAEKPEIPTSTDSDGKAQPSDQDAKKPGEPEPGNLTEEKRKELEKKFEAWDRSGEAPMCVVRLFFVGKGRAGKTSTLRRLKGDVKEFEETSTYGVEVWAGEAREQLESGTSSWQKSKADATSLGAASTLSEETQQRKEIKKGPEEKPKEDTARVSKSSLPKADDIPEQPQREDLPKPSLPPAPVVPTQEDKRPEKTMQIETIGAKKMDVDLVFKLGNESKAGQIRPRLQCWDFPGQQEYAICNLLYFNGRGNYLVFCDTSCEFEECWLDLKFWLYTIVQHGTDSEGTTADLPRKQRPPVLIIGTKWNKRSRTFVEEDLDQRIEEFIGQMPDLKQQLQLGPGLQVCKSKWLFPIENCTKDFEDFVTPLRKRLEKVTMEVVTPQDFWQTDLKQSIPLHVGLQSKPYPSAWLRANDLLVQLADGVNLTFDEQKFEENFEPSPTSPRHGILKNDLMGHEGKDARAFLAPKHASVEITSERGSTKIQAKITCNSLKIAEVQSILAKMEPTSIKGEEVKELLQLLHNLGILFWFGDASDAILLNIRKVAVALASIISLRFWDECGFAHESSFKEKLTKIEESMWDDVQSFKTSGVASERLLHRLWAPHFETHEREDMQKVLKKVMLQKALLLPRGMQEEYLVPSCLPTRYLPEPQGDSVVWYLRVEGFISPNLFPKISDAFRKKLSPDVQSVRLGPPQLFRNRIEVYTETGLASITAFPDAPKMPFRFQVLNLDDSAESKKAKDTMELFVAMFWEAVGLAVKSRDGMELKPLKPEDLETWMLKSTSSTKDEPGNKELFEKNKDEFINDTPCLQLSCRSTCSLCKSSILVKERFWGDLSEELLKVARVISLDQRSRPFGSFRFHCMKYPGDVDVEEYVVIKVGEADKKGALKDEASKKLAERLRDLCKKVRAYSQGVIHWGGLKAGFNPNKKDEYLTWSLDQVENGREEVSLEDALKQGHRAWTAKIDLFAKTTLFKHTENEVPKFVEVTNVIRFGYALDDGIVCPVTREKDFLSTVGRCADEYSGPKPKAIKYVKRLWEESAYYAQRGMNLDRHLSMLEALKPLWSHWAAKLAQVAAHAKTLKNILEHEEMQRDGLEDVLTLCDSLKNFSTDEKELVHDEASEEGKRCIEDVLKRLEPLEKRLKVSLEQPGDFKEQVKKVLKQVQVKEVLKEVQELLECCVEVVVSNYLGQIQTPLRAALKEKWRFCSDHLPIGARIRKSGVVIDVASWSVLNQNCLEFIEQKGLQRSQINQLSEKERITEICNKVLGMLEHKAFPKQILCLQECWPKLLEVLRSRLDPRIFSLECSANKEECEQQENLEVVVYDSMLWKMQSCDRHQPKSKDTIKAVMEIVLERKVEGEALKIRILTTHLPGTPYGEARREFCDCLAKLMKCESFWTIPTLLLGDLSFPDEAIRPLLLHHKDLKDLKGAQKLDGVEFLPIPYPTNICEGSLLPKRTDSIVSLFSKDALDALKVEALGPEQVLPNLTEFVNLLMVRKLDTCGVPEDECNSGYMLQLRKDVAHVQADNEELAKRLKEEKTSRYAMDRIQHLENQRSDAETGQMQAAEQQAEDGRCPGRLGPFGRVLNRCCPGSRNDEPEDNPQPSRDLRATGAMKSSSVQPFID